MRKYVGKYSVQIERDNYGEFDKGGFTYLNCNRRNKNGKIYRYSDSILISYISSAQKARNMMKEISDIGVDVVKFVEYDGEIDIWFNEIDLGKLKDIFCISELSNKRHPESLKNHPRYKEIKKEKFDSLSDEEKEERIAKGNKLRDMLRSKKESV